MAGLVGECRMRPSRQGCVVASVAPPRHGGGGGCHPAWCREAGNAAKGWFGKRELPAASSTSAYGKMTREQNCATFRSSSNLPSNDHPRHERLRRRSTCSRCAPALNCCRKLAGACARSRIRAPDREGHARPGRSIRCRRCQGRPAFYDGPPRSGRRRNCATHRLPASCLPVTQPRRHGACGMLGAISWIAVLSARAA